MRIVHGTLIGIAAGALAAALPVGAETAAPAPAPAKVKKVCKSNAKTGSRLGVTRTCKTQAQWDAIARQAQDDNQDMMNKPGAGPGGG